MPISLSVFIKPCAQCTWHFVVLIDVPAFPMGSSLLHTGGHPFSGTFLPHGGIGQGKLEMRQEEIGPSIPHLQPAWSCQGGALPQACSPHHISLCCLQGVCSISVSQPHTFLSRKAPDAIGRQQLSSLREEAAGSKAWCSSTSIFSRSSQPGPHVLVSSAVRGGGQVTGPDQWNVAESVR